MPTIVCDDNNTCVGRYVWSYSIAWIKYIQIQKEKETIRFILIINIMREKNKEYESF
jgi:hypothetical protein